MPASLATSLPNLLFRIGRRALSEATRVVWPYDRLATARLAGGAAPIDPPPVLIVGAPRTGSTLLYQVLTNTFDVAYVSNLSRLFCHALLTGQQLDAAVHRARPHNAFRSANGWTPGLDGPNEGDAFWYRFFPRDRHFVDEHGADPEAMRRLRREIAAVARLTGKPFVAKNLTNGQRLRPLRRALPEALVVYIKRDPLATAASILDGRARVLGDKAAWWSVEPQEVEALRGLPYPEQVVKQVWYLQRQIETDLAAFPEAQTLTVRHEEVCADVPAALDRFRAFFACNGVRVREREGALLPAPRTDRPSALTGADWNALRAETERLAW